MQRTLQVIAFALLCVGAFTYSASNFAKDPVAVTLDTLFTTNEPELSTAFAGSIDVYATTTNATVLTNITWTMHFQKINNKALSAEASTRNVTGNLTDIGPVITNGYMINIALGTVGGSTIGQVVVLQKSLSGGASIPPFALTSNTDAKFNMSTMSPVLMAFGKTVAVIYNTQTGYNLTSFKVGGSAAGASHVITSVKTDTPAAIWGEALKATQLYITWNDQTATPSVYKSATFDIGSGIIGTPASPTKMATGMVCGAYTTDKKYYGDYCTVAGMVNTTAVTSFYIRTNGTDLYWVANLTTGEEPKNFVAYGQYLALFFVSHANATETRSVEILNLDTLTAFKAKTAYLTITDAEKAKVHINEARVDQGGYYMLFADKAGTDTAPTFANFKVGLLLSGSTLSTVFGALLALIAGLFLF